MKAFLLFVLTCAVRGAGGTVVTVNYGYFKDPAAHSWTYAVDAHSWTDVVTNTTYKYIFWPQTGGGKVIKKLQTGELDIAHLGSSPYSTGALRGVPMQMLYVIHVKDLSQCLVARRGLNTPHDLKGKRVAYVGGSTTHFMFSGLMLATGLTPSDFEWLGHMEAGAQMAAWDRGEIDAGFMWGGGMLYVQSSPWCSQPDPSSPNYRPCDSKAANSLGRNLFTSGTSKMWGTEVWNNLVVSNAFAAAHPETVFRSVKVVSAIDTRMVSDGGFFTNSADRMCAILISVGRPCTEADERFWADALYWDTFLSATQQVSGGYVGEKVPGECARQQIGQYPNNDGPCNAETAAGSAVSTWSAAAFAYQLKRVGYLPSIKYFQSLMAQRYITAAADPALDHFPEITAASLAANYSTPGAGAANPAFDFCGQQTQPIRLSGASGVLQDHKGGGFHQDGVRCDWQLDSTTPLLLSNIDVRIERDADNVYIYDGLCTGSQCSELPLLATFTGGKGTGPNTLHQLNPRPPVLAPRGQATISFVPDPTADVPLLAIVDDGVTMEWSPAPSDGTCALPCLNGGVCQEGECKCVGGWGGADCSSPTCLGTVRLEAGATPGTILNGVQTSPTAHNADCRWEVVAEDPSWVIVVEIQSLDLDWGFDPLEFFEGIGLTGPSLGRFSGYFTPKLNAACGEKCPGAQCPGYVVSNTSSMTIRWSSDSMDSGLGFTLRYFAGPPDDFVCGTGSVANCAGHGTCSPAGCICDEGWYGKFCKLRQCTGETIITGLQSGQIRNMATTEGGYGPNKACTWVVRVPPADGQEAGAVAVYLERFMLEDNVQAQDSLTIGATTLVGSSRPCLSTAGNRSACRPEVVLGTELTISFSTDSNDYPHGAEFDGFQLTFEAVYDCPRGADGRCLPLSDCAVQGMVPGLAVCEPCPFYQYFDSLTSSCRVCGQGLVPGPNQLSCILCPAGKVVLDPEEGNCTSCEPGRYAAQRGMTACVDCEPGTFAQLEDRVSCDLATQGHYVNGTGAVGQTPCPPGSVSAEMGLFECKPCHPGTAQDMSGRSICDRCRRGTFASTGAQFCSTCPGSRKGIPFAMTTDETGTEVSEQCGCPEGSYRDRELNSTKCHPCPQGMFCEFGSDEQALWGQCHRPTDPAEGCAIPVTQPGFMTLPDEPLSVWQCENKERCPGGPPGTCASRLTGLSCQHCVSGYQWDGRECTECSSFAQGYVLFPVLPICLIPILVILFYKLFGDKIERWGSWQNGMAALLFILLNHFQIVTILRGVNMAVPIQVGQAYEVLSISSDFTGLFQPECTGYARFQDSVLLKSSGPLIVLGMFILVWAVSQLIAKYCGPKSVAMEVNRTINAFLSIIFAFFGAIVEMAFAIFKCGPNPNGRSSMLTDRSMICFTDEWRGMLAIGIGAVLLWCIGFAALLIRTILLAPYWFDDENVQMRWKFLFIKYRPDVHWWALVIVCKGILLQQGQLFLDSGIAQLFYLMTVMLLYVVLITIFRPWRHLLANLVDAWAHLCMLMSASAMLSYAEDRLSLEEKATLDQQMSAISLTWCFLVVPVSVAVLLSMIWIQKSSSGKLVVAKSMEVIRDAFLLVKATSNKELDLFVASSGQVDFYIYHAAAVSLLAELGGRRTRRRVTSHTGHTDSPETTERTSVNSGNSSEPPRPSQLKMGHAGQKAVDAGPPFEEAHSLELEEIEDEERGPSRPPVSNKVSPGGVPGVAANGNVALAGVAANGNVALAGQKPAPWLLEPGPAPPIQQLNSDSYSC